MYSWHCLHADAGVAPLGLETRNKGMQSFSSGSFLTSVYVKAKMVSGVAQLLNKAACWLLISALDCFYKTHTVTVMSLAQGVTGTALTL